MATIIIKDSASNNQAQVFSNGSLSVTPAAAGPPQDVNIFDSNGNPITSTGGRLNTMVGGFSTITPGYPTQVFVGTTSVTLLPANPNRVYAHFVNNSSQAIYMQYQGTAALNQGIYLSPNSLYTIDANNLWLGEVNGIGLIASQPITVLEGE